MTPQANFMVLAPIDPVRRTELEQLLDSMNNGPGQVNADNSLIPFTQFHTLHFARLVILNDGTLTDTRAHGGGPVPTYPLYLAFLGDIDGEVDSFFKELARRAGNGLRRIFSCCEGFTAGPDLVTWMKAHEAPAIAARPAAAPRTEPPYKQSGRSCAHLGPHRTRSGPAWPQPNYQIQVGPPAKLPPARSFA